MYKRIIILGGSGAGKSTLANRISLYTNYPVYHLDNLLLYPNWEMKDKDNWTNICQIFLSEDVGVVDGNYSSCLPARIEWADLIIFIDIPTRIQLWRVFKRMIKIRLGFDKRFGLPDGAKEILRTKFVLWVLGWNKNRRQKVYTMLDEVKNQKKVIITHSAKDLNLEEIFK